MKSMREMMSLMEGVGGSIAGGAAGAALTKSPSGALAGAELGSDIQDKVMGEDLEDLDEKSTSEKQARFMAACAHGADYDSCPPDKVSKEFNKADTGTKQLSNAMKENLSPDDENFISPAVKHFISQAKDMEELCTIVSSEVGYPNTPEFKALVQREANKYFGDERPEEPEDDYTDWSMRQGEMGLEEDDMKEAHVDSCRQTNPAIARKACKMEENAFDENFATPDFSENENITLASKMYKDYTDSWVPPQEALDLVMRHFDEMGLEAQELDEIGDAIMTQYGGPSDEPYEPMPGPDDFSDDADALGSAGMGTDEYYGGDDGMIESVLDIFDFDSDDEEGGSLVSGSRIRSRQGDASLSHIGTGKRSRPVTNKYGDQLHVGQTIMLNDKGPFTIDKIGVPGNYTMLVFAPNPAGTSMATPDNAMPISDMGNIDIDEDLQNGYHDRHCARGDDYFPNGADSPVVRKVGPSGARHGDNPEQKKMQIEEVHKELVYGYRSFLGEAAKKSEKKKVDPYRNKYDYLSSGGLGSTSSDSNDHEKWNKEEARIAKLRKADAKKAKQAKKK